MRSGHRRDGLPRTPVEAPGDVASEIWDPPFMRRLHDRPLHRATPATRVLHIVPNTPTMPPAALFDKVVGHPSTPVVVVDHTRRVTLRGNTFMPSPSPFPSPRSPQKRTPPSKAPEWRSAPSSPRHIGVSIEEAKTPDPAPSAPLLLPTSAPEAAPRGRMVVKHRDGADPEAEVERLKEQLTMSQGEVKRLQSLLGVFLKTLQNEVSHK